jgi:hypothetical protein
MKGMKSAREELEKNWSGSRNILVTQRDAGIMVFSPPSQ